jgi:hypothetical protein
MRKILPLGLSLIKMLACLLLMEALLFAAGAASSHGQSIVVPPHEIGDWIASRSETPISDFQRDNPTQISVTYSNGNQAPVHVDFSAVQSLDSLRQPQKYLVDSDGRISRNEAPVVTYHKRNAYIISAILGIDKTLIDMHWCQKPGGSPVPAVSDATLDAVKAILFRYPRFYVCDVWVEWRPTMNGPEVRAMLQQFADTLSDKIKRGGK